MYQRHVIVFSIAKFQKAIFVMQREAANDLAFQYVKQSRTNSTRKRRSLPTTTASWLLNLLDRRLLNLKKFMKIAVTSDSIEFARSAFAKSLLVFIEVSNMFSFVASHLSFCFGHGYIRNATRLLGSRLAGKSQPLFLCDQSLFLWDLHFTY